MANAALAELIGISAEALAGGNLHHHFHPEDHRRAPDLLASARREPIARPVRILRSDGAVRWVRLNLGPSGSGFVAFLEDTTPPDLDHEIERAVADRFELLARFVSDAILIVDDDGRIRQASAGLKRMLGFAPEEVEGASAFDFLHPDDRAAAMETFRDELDLAYDGPRVIGLRVRRRDGSWCEVEVSATNHVADGTMAGLLVTLHDVSAIRQARARERAADQRFRLLVDSLPDPVVMFDAQLRYRYANPTACSLLGRPLDRLRGRTPRESGLPPAIAGAWERGIRDVLATGAVRDLELAFLGKGSQRWFWTRLAPERDAQGRVTQVVAVGRDITDRKEAERRLEDLARRDPLTGLANRRHLEDVLRRGLERSHASGQALAVLFMDLDGLKKVNDTHGHDIGDGLLLAVARRLRHVARVHDTVARLGGDEFVVVCEAISGSSEAVEVARRLLARVDRPYAVSGLSLHIGASLGIVTVMASEATAVTPTQLLREADAAMYHAKVHGGGTLATFDRRADEPVLPLDAH